MSARGTLAWSSFSQAMHTSRADRRPTRRQVEVLRAYIRAGSVVAAALDLGISPATTRQHLHALYRRTGCQNAAQAAYLLGRADLERAGRPPHDRDPV